MTRVLGLSLLMFVSAQIAAAEQGTSLEGTYKQKHEIVMPTYTSAKACKKDGGRWEGDFCLFQGSDDLTIQQKDGQYTISVSTVATNAHSCDYEGAAQLTAPNTLISKSDLCEVKVVVSENGQKASVESNSECREFCGARAILDIGEAVKQAPSVQEQIEQARAKLRDAILRRYQAQKSGDEAAFDRIGLEIDALSKEILLLKKKAK